MLATTVESTTLAAVDYDSARQLLWLEFRSHALYCYFDVPAAIYQDLLEADSKGVYFNRHIRNRFPYRSVDTDAHTSVPTTHY
jgi:hypothetical protein